MLVATLSVFPSFKAQAVGPSDLFGAIGNHLAILDKTTGDATDVGVMGSFTDILGLSFDSRTDTLYGIAWNPAFDSFLIKIDRGTGTATVIGPTGFIAQEALAFNPVDGLLYGAAGRNFGFSDTLVTVDPATGVATAIAPFTGDAIGRFPMDVDALEFVNGVLYAVDGTQVDFSGEVKSFLYTVALGNGTAIRTLVGEIGFWCCNDLAYDPETNKLFANDVVQLPGGGFGGRLIAISLSTGQGTLIGDTPEFDGGRLTALAFVPAPVKNVAIDIKPQSCPNPLNVNEKGVLPVAILGGVSFDVSKVEPASVTLEGVAALRSSLEDVATPFVPFTGKRRATDCTAAGPDGVVDLTLHFDAPTVVASLGTVTDGEVRVLKLTGNLKPEFGGAAITGEDVVVIRKKK